LDYLATFCDCQDWSLLLPSTACGRVRNRSWCRARPFFPPDPFSIPSQQNKEIFVLPHRINESLATNELIKKGLAKAIYDIDEFIEDIVGVGLFGFENSFDEILEYCKSNPIYDEVLLKYPDKILEYELDGKIAIKDGKVFVL